MTTSLWYDILLIALGVLIPAALLAGPKVAARVRKKRDAVARRDAILSEMRDMIREIGGDVRCLYESQPATFNALEVALKALKGEHVNGNVTEAIKQMQDARDSIMKRMTAKTGCGQ